MDRGRWWPLALFALFLLLTGGVLLWSWSGAAPAPLPADAPALQIRGGGVPLAANVWSPLLRVNVTPRPQSEVTMAIAGAYRITPVESRRVLGEGKELTETRAVATATGIRLGDRDFPVTRLELHSQSAAEIWVNEHAYRGSVRLFRQEGGRLIAVNAVPLESYIASVVDSEMPADFPEAARKAQAIVSRTYALYQREFSRRHPYFELYSTTRSQNYLGVKYRSSDGRLLAGETEAGRRIARETAGMVCVSGGRLFCTYYSAVCGGRTTPGEAVFSDAAPPLKSVPCTWCAESPRYRWSHEISRSALQASLDRVQAVKRQGLVRLTSISPSPGSSPIHPSTFQVSDGSRTVEVSAEELRRILPAGALPSPRFSIVDRGERLTFEGRGHGHGVGLCQWGARGQALAGRTEVQIVQHYYPGASIVRLEAR